MPNNLQRVLYKTKEFNEKKNQTKTKPENLKKMHCTKKNLVIILIGGKLVTPTPVLIDILFTYNTNLITFNGIFVFDSVCD